MRTSALFLSSIKNDGPKSYKPFVKTDGDHGWSPYVGMLADGPYMASIAEPQSIAKWKEVITGLPNASWKDLLLLALGNQHMTYGGAGITTNRLNGAGSALNGGWGLNTASLATAITDTALFCPAPENRVAGTPTLITTAANIPNDTLQEVVVITASAGRAIIEFGLFDGQNITTGTAAQTTLGSTVATNSLTTLSVGATTGFTNGGYAQIDSEVVSITSSSAGTLTVGRGARGSAAATHSANTAVVGGEGIGSNMFMKADFAVVSLNTGDSISFTAKAQFQPQ